MTAGVNCSLHYSSRYSKNQHLKFIPWGLERLRKFFCNDFRNKSNVVTFIECKGFQATKQCRETLLWGIKEWAHVCPLMSLCGPMTSCLVSGSSWNLAGGFLLEKICKSASFGLLLPGFFEIRKGGRLQSKKVCKWK